MQSNKRFKSETSERSFKYWADMPKYMNAGEKMIKIYRNIPSSSFVEYFDEKTGIHLDEGEIRNTYYSMFSEDLNACEYLLAKCEYCTKTHVCENVEECYKNFMIGAGEIHYRTKFKILSYGLYDKCLKAAQYFNLSEEKRKMIYNFEPVHNSKEIEFIDNTSGGGLQYLKRHWVGTVYKYDKISMYPSIMASDAVAVDGLFVPYKEGTYGTSDLNAFLQENYFYYMVKNVKIIFSENCTEVIKKGFTKKVPGYYTHFEIKLAKLLGCKFTTLDNSGKVDFIYYSKEQCIPCNEMIGRIIKDIYEVKRSPHTKQGKFYAKIYLSKIWGKWSERKAIHKMAEYQIQNRINYLNKEKVFDLTGLDMTECTFIYNSERVITDINRPVKRYNSFLPRIKPFLLSRARTTVMLESLSFPGEIIRMHTDCFWITEKCALFEKDTINKMGKTGYEGFDTLDTEKFRSRIL